MTTDGEIIELVRDIDVLLALGTYQGMSDAEIDSVLDYKINVALASDAHTATMAALESQQRIYGELLSDIAQQSKSMLQSTLGTSIPWVMIGSDS